MKSEREFGFTIGWAKDGEEESAFLENIKFVEFWHRSLHPRKRFTLRERLESLAADLPIGGIAVFTDCFEALTDKIIRTRNYLTHFDPLEEVAAQKGDDLRVITLKLAILLMLHTYLIDYGLEATKEFITKPGSAFLQEHLKKSDKINQIALFPK
jgi:ApeA N-terminal domain 1